VRSTVSQAPASQPPAEDVVRSLACGLEVIGALGVPGPGRTASEVAAELRLSRSRTYRVLATLCQLGYVRTYAGRFALTPKMLELGYRQWSGLDLADVAKPHLDELLEKTQEACSVSILDGHTIVCVARATARRLMGVAEEVGTRLPAYATAQGRVLLAALTPEELNEYLARADLRPLTRATIVSSQDLRRELDGVRRRGWASVDEELEPGLRSVSVPIAGARGVTAAVGIVTDTHRVSLAKLRGILLAALRATAERIQSDLALSDHR